MALAWAQRQEQSAASALLSLGQEAQKATLTGAMLGVSSESQDVYGIRCRCSWY